MHDVPVHGLLWIANLIFLFVLLRDRIIGKPMINLKRPSFDCKVLLCVLGLTAVRVEGTMLRWCAVWAVRGVRRKVEQWPAVVTSHCLGCSKAIAFQSTTGK